MKKLILICIVLGVINLGLTVYLIQDLPKIFGDAFAEYLEKIQ